MPKVVITGNTRGIGLNFYQHFLSKQWHVVGFNSSTGLDHVVQECEDCDLFINNAYADGKQIELFELLHDRVPRIVVCGSVAAFYPDPRLPIYSKHKNQLANKVRQSPCANLLMLHLSAKGYNNPSLLLKIIDTWLDSPSVMHITFDPSGEPNV